MAGHCNNERLEAALILGDVFLENAAASAAAISLLPPANPRPSKRARKEKANGSQEDVTSASSNEVADCLAALQEVLSGLPEFEEPPEAKGQWSVRQTVVHERWEAARPGLLDALLSAAEVGDTSCSYCGRNAVVRCLDCLPRHFFCSRCDLKHRHHVLHDREHMLNGFFKPIPPTDIIVESSDGYSLVSEARLLPVAFPGACSTCRASVEVRPGRSVTLVTMKGSRQRLRSS
ncbi:uncharacterized protein LOC134444050 [Engraulis encrasicolus]|uniref:uncharacterized protein LOC134444050 n=1 Tax=Engraulis encrasicolus TaxID=184585 RepID=UPI002FD6F3BF